MYVGLHREPVPENTNPYNSHYLTVANVLFLLVLAPSRPAWAFYLTSWRDRAVSSVAFAKAVETAHIHKDAASRAVLVIKQTYFFPPFRLIYATTIP